MDASVTGRRGGTAVGCGGDALRFGDIKLVLSPDEGSSPEAEAAAVWDWFAWQVHPEMYPPDQPLRPLPAGGDASADEFEQACRAWWSTLDLPIDDSQRVEAARHLVASFQVWSGFNRLLQAARLAESTMLCREPARDVDDDSRVDAVEDRCPSGAAAVGDDETSRWLARALIVAPSAPRAAARL